MVQKNDNHTHITLDLGPSTLLMLSELVLVALKLMGHIGASWLLVLSPIVMVIAGATVILLLTLIRVLTRNLF
jgi:hypothetical protein